MERANAARPAGHSLAKRVADLKRLKRVGAYSPDIDIYFNAMRGTSKRAIELDVATQPPQLGSSSAAAAEPATRNTATDFDLATQSPPAISPTAGAT